MAATAVLLRLSALLLMLLLLLLLVSSVDRADVISMGMVADDFAAPASSPDVHVQTPVLPAAAEEVDSPPPDTSDAAQRAPGIVVVWVVVADGVGAR